jgi:hypothetical protein
MFNLMIKNSIFQFKKSKNFNLKVIILYLYRVITSIKIYQKNYLMKKMKKIQQHQVYLKAKNQIISHLTKI